MKRAAPRKAKGTSKDLAGLAIRYVEKGDLDAALRSLEEAERRGKRLDSVRRRLARALSERALSGGNGGSADGEGNGGDPAHRIAAMREACALTPRDPLSWRNLGRLLYGLGDYSGALDAYGEAERVGDDADVVLRLSALARLRSEGESGGGLPDPYPAPLSRRSRRIARKTISPPIRLGGALLLLRRGDLGRAREEIASILTGDPSLEASADRNARHYFGRLLLLAGKPLEAIPPLREAARSEEKDPTLPGGTKPHLLRALLGAAVEARDPGMGIRFLLEAGGIGPGHEEQAGQIDAVGRLLLRRLVGQDRLREALPLLEAARKREPLSPHREKDLALAFERLGETDRAIRHWEKAIRLGKRRLHDNRDDSTCKRFLVAALRHTARLDRKMGRTAKSSRKLTFSLQLDPDRLPVRKELGEMLLGLGRYREALRCLAPIEEDPKAGPEVWTQMGIACDRMGQSDKAIAFWERASKSHPLARRLLIARLHERFLLSFRAGDLEGARREVDRARIVDPGDRDIVLDANCLAVAGGGAEESLPANGGNGGRGAWAFSPRPEAATGTRRLAQSVCCGDGTRCEAVRALILRLVEQEGAAGAAPVQRALLKEGCRMIVESLAASLDGAEEDERPA